jgi:S-formylglutathione hydrolase FrmB
MIGGIAALGACSAPPSGASGGNPPEPTPESLAGKTTTAQEQVSTDRVHSPARRSTVELVMIRPARYTGRLPVCLALHGRSSTARMFLDLGVPEMLNAVIATGVQPFAVVAVDGGNSYWVARDSNDDPQRMLAEDLPTWLTNRGFAASPFAAFGISMGGYGALNYARNSRLSAVAAVSAALFASWPDARSRNAFVDQAAWEATEPLLHVDEIKTDALGVWCGTDDPFIDRARELVDKAKPRVSALGNGGHNETYWRRILPEVLHFVGETLP